MRKVIILATILLTGIFAIAQVPVINSFSPTTGIVGSTVTITGSGFDGSSVTNNQVFFGSAQGTVLTATFSSLTVKVPNGATSNLISVRNATSKRVAYSRNHFNAIFCLTPLNSTTYNSYNLELAGIYGAYNIDIYDMDGDGKSDIITGKNDGGLTIARNQSTIGAMNFLPYNIATSANVQQFFVADFDGDGKRDIVIAGGHGAYLYPNLSTPGTLSFGARITITNTVGFYQCAAGDLNNDGKIDFVGGTHQLFTYVNTSTGVGNFGFTASTVLTPTGCTATGIQCVDVDGDGISDIVGTSRLCNQMFAIRNTTPASNTTLTFNSTQTFSCPGEPYRLKLGDFDKDGRIDLVTPLYTSYQTGIFRNTSTVGNINFSTLITLPASYQNYRVGVGDVNGDGLPDIVTKPNGIGTIFQVFQNVSSGAGNISFNGQITYSSSAGSEVGGIAIGDMDGDLVPDIATSGVSTNVIRFHRNTSSVPDNTPPTASCKNIIVALGQNGTVTVTPDMIDNGSSDACGIGSLKIHKASGTAASSVTFSCADLGNNTVTLTVADNAGNISTCTATVTVAPAAIIVSGQTTVCQGQTVTLTANSGDSYQWQKDGVNISGATAQTYIATATGNYTVTVTNSGGCSGTSAPTAVTVNTNPSVSTSPTGNASFCPSGGSLTITASLSSIYQWKLNGNNINGATQQNLTVNAAGSYSVVVIDLFGCSATSSPVVVTAADNEAPVITCPSNITANTNGSNCGAVVTFANPVVTDNCTIATQSVTQTFNYTGNIVDYVVPAGVTSITVDAYGAQGGTGTTYGISLPGGKGANIKGTVSVTPGETLKILVGQMGGSSGGPHGNENGGGGGSFVVRQAGNVPLVIAGGGGGGASTSYGLSCTRTPSSADGQAGTSGVTVSCFATGNGGTSGGGGSTAGSYQGGAGGGFAQNGANGGTHCSTAFGGQSFLNGGAGGAGNTCYNTNNYGGFGGGGGGQLGGPGGGGGYSGGGSAGSWSSYSTYGGGGGSYNAGTGQTNTSGARLGNGLVTITTTGTSGPTIVQTAGLPSGSVFPIGTTTNTFTATDASGNTSSCSFTVTVVDNTPPTVVSQNVTVQLDANGNASIVSGQVFSDVLTENFSQDPNGLATSLSNWNFAQSGMTVDVGDYITGNGSTEIDLAGNTNAKITSKKSLYLVPGQYRLTFDNRLNNNPSGGNSVRVTIGSFTQDFASQLTAVTESATFTVSTATSVNVVLEQLGTNDAAGSFIGNIRLARVINPSYSVFVNATDCSGLDGISVSKSTFNCSNIGVNTVVLTVKDVHGNQTQQNVTVTVQDNILPTITCPANQEISLDASCSAVLPDYTGLVVTSDNCGPVTVTQSPAPGTSVSQRGAMIVTFTATDAAGNSSTCNISVDKKDGIAPVITCPANINVNTNGACNAVVTYPTPTAIDNCSGSAFNHFNPGEPNNAGNEHHLQLYNNATWNDLNGGNSMVYIIEINSIYPNAITNYTRIGEFGGHTYYKSNFTANWNTARSNALALGLGADLASINTLGESTFLAPHGGSTWVGGYQDLSDPGYAEPGTAAQNFGGWKWVDGTKLGAGQITITRIAGPASGSAFPVGPTTVTYRATDESGNSSTCSFIVTVTDNQKPVITHNGNQNVFALPGLCNANPIVSANATDNCSVAAPTGVRSDNQPMNAPYPVGTTVVTWNVTDINNNTAIPVTQTVTVTDTQKPFITHNGNQTAVNTPGRCDAVVSVSASATDNCSVGTPTGVRSDNQPLNAPYPVGTTTITWSVTDVNGNTAIPFTQTVTVTDDENPVITCPAPISVNTDPNVCGALVTYAMPTATDNCSGGSGNSGGKILVAGADVDSWVTDVQNALINTGQFNTVDQINLRLVTPTLAQLQQYDAVLVYTNYSPINSVTLGNNLADYINSGGRIVDAVFDNASIPIQGSYNSPTYRVLNPASQTQFNGIRTLGTVLVPGHPIMQGVTSFSGGPGSYRSTSTSMTAGAYTIALYDNGESFIMAKENVGAAGARRVSVNFFPPSSNVASDFWNSSTNGAKIMANALTWVSGGGSINITQTSGLPSGSVFPVGTTTNTFVATDAAGNTSTCSFNVTVTDNQVPVITHNGNKNVVADQGRCDAVVTVSATATDNCSVGTPTGVRSDNQSLNAPYPVGTTTITWNVTDVNGNAAAAVTQTVVVTDNQLPVISNMPANITRDATFNMCGALVTWTNPTVTDNCPGVTFTTNNSDFNTFGFALLSVGVHTITYTATDAAGNQRSASFTVTIVDNQNPIITGCPQNITVNTATGTCNAQALWNPPTASDNCPGVSMSGTHISGQTFPIGTTTVTYTATDAAGRTATCSFTVTVTDNERPVISNCPANITVQTGSGSTVCSQTATWTVPTATDNCGGVTVTSTHQPGATFTVGTTTVAYTFTDQYGNASVCSFTVTVVDNTVPVISCVAPMVVNNDQNICGAAVTYATPTATDNCGGAADLYASSKNGGLYKINISTGAGTFIGNLPGGTTEITYNNITQTAFMQYPNGSFSGQFFNINTGAAIGGSIPNGNSFTGLEWVGNTLYGTVIRGGGGTFPSELRKLNPNTGAHTLVGVTGLNSPISGLAYDATTSTMYGITGGSNAANLVRINLATGQATVIGSTGFQAGSLAFGPDGNLYGGHTGADPGLLYRINKNTGAATLVGNTGFSDVTGLTLVGTSSVSVTQTAGLTSGSIFPVGTTTNTFVATDASGNTSTCSFTVTVNDVQAPTISCPANINAIATSAAGATVNYTTPVGTDNCAGATTAITAGLASGSTFPIGTTTVTYQVTDATGLTAQCSFTVTVVGVPPSIVCPDNIVVNNTTGQCGANVNFAATETTAIPASVITYSHQPGSFFPVGTTTVTATATNAVGSSVCTFTVTVVDNEVPVFNVPNLPTITAECSATAPVPAATDNCSGAINGVPAGPTSFSTQGTHTITWTYTDAAGNTSSQTQTVVIDDNTPPVIACPFDIVVNATTGTCGATVTYNQPSATDNCGSGNLPTSIPGYTYKGIHNGHSYFVSNNTARPEDAHAAAIALGGHLATISNAAENALVSGFLPNQPMWIGYTDRDVEGTYRWITNEPVTYTNWAAGEPNNAGGNEDWAVINWANSPKWNDWYYYQPAYYVVEFEGGAIPTTLVSGPASGSVFPVGTTVVTYSATDAGGNTVTCSFKVTVNDTERPQLIGIPANTTVECDAVPARASVTATDNCPGVGNVNFSEQRINGNCAGNYTLKRTWTVTDAHGNTTTATQTITVQDTQAPAITTAASHMTVECDGAGNTAALNAWLSSNGGAAASDACGTVTWTNNFTGLSDDCGSTGFARVIFTAKDDCGNASSTIATFTIEDTQAPAIVCPANATVSCEASTSTSALGVATATDVCSNVTITHNDVSTQSGDVNSAAHYNYTITRTWTAVDECNNVTECVQTITVRDITAPVITCPANTTVNCQDDNTSASNGVATATDNCAPVAITQSETSTKHGDPNNAGHYNYVITRTWRATDVTGNFSECVQTITVRDITAPMITCPANTTVNCQDDNTSASNGVATATDNCAPVAITQSETSTKHGDPNNAGHYNYVITRTWRATDVSGNFSECVQTITVRDITAPVITCPANTTVNCQDDNTSGSNGVATATDNCAPVAITQSETSTKHGDPNNAGHYNYVITRTWRATDVTGNFSECVQTVTVRDITAPVATCTNVTITLVNGAASITPQMINSGSTDNCSPLILSVSKSNFNCSNLGANTVTLTVKDVSGNTSTCTATVTVVGEIPTCSIASVPTSNTYTGGVSTNLYLGYGAQSTTLQLSVPSSGAPYTFNWTGNGTLSSTTVQSPLFAPTAAGNYTFTVLVTNKYGCTTTCTISICVTDIRVLSSNGTWDGKKVYICHIPPGNPGNANTLEVSVNAVPAHIGPLGHATDRLGKCTQTACTGGTYSKAPVTPTIEVATEMTVKLSPNPTTNYFALQVISSDRKTPVVIRVMDRLGKVLETRKGTVDELYRFGSSFINGTYFFEVLQGENRKVVQGVKAN